MNDLPSQSLTQSNVANISFISAIRSPAVYVPVILVSLLLLLTTVTNELMRDDYMHRALLLGEEVIPGYSQPAFDIKRAAFELFSFSSQDSDILAKAKSYGNVPWWSHDDLKVSFWRPLAAVTHWLDYQLWPDNPAMMHLHSLLWYSLLAVALGYWLMQLGVGRLTLWLVMGLYVLDASHLHAIGWIANRNILIATTFGLLSLIQLTRWSATAGRVSLGLSLLFYLLALLSAEAAVSLFGLVLAFLLFADNNALAKRLLPFAGFILLTIVWRVIYSELGYGSANSGFYLDPINNTGGFLRSLWVNGPIMLYEQLIRIPSLSMLMSPAVELNQLIISWLVLIIALLILTPLLFHNRLARFGFFAAILAIPPACATLVSGGRLMFFFGIGICLLLGLWFTALKEQPDWLAKRKVYKVLAYLWSLAIGLAVIGGTGFVWYSKISNVMTNDQPRFNAYTDVLDKVHEDQTLVLINPPVLFEQMYLPLKGNYFGMDLPNRMMMLVPGYTAVNVSKSGERGISLAGSSGFMIKPQVPWQQQSTKSIHFAYLFRRVDSFFTSGDLSFEPNASIPLPDARLEIIAMTDQGDPKQIKVSFSQPINGDNYLFLYWDWDKNQYVKLDISTLGDSGLSIPGPF